MADQLPAEVGRGQGTLLGGFLDPILADGPETEAIGQQSGLDRVGLGDRQQPDGGRVAAGKDASGLDAGQHPLAMGLELVGGDHFHQREGERAGSQPTGIPSPPGRVPLRISRSTLEGLRH